MKRYLASAFASFTVRNYRLYFVGQAISVTGNWMQKLGMGWLVLELTNSGILLGIAVAATQLPTLVLGPYAGGLADRFDKRRILLVVATAGAVPSLILGVWTALTDVSVATILALALISGVVDCLEKPARQSFPSEMVPLPLLANAVTLNQVIQDIGKAVGPAIAALSIAAVGIPATFMVNALTYVAVFFGLLLMRPAELFRVERAQPAKHHVRDGLVYVWRTPQLLGPVVLLFAIGLFAYNFQVMLTLLGKETFDGDASHAGYLLAAQGVGAIVGGLAIASVVRPTPRGIVMSAAVLGGLFVLIGLAPTYPLALIAVLAMGVGSVLFKTMASSWLQLTADPLLRGRVMALMVMAIAGTTPIGGPLVGWLASQFSTRSSFLICGLAAIVTALSGYLYLRRKNALTTPTSAYAGVPESVLTEAAIMGSTIAETAIVEPPMSPPPPTGDGSAPR